MRFVLKEKLISWGDDFHIQDDAGRDVYFVDGKAFSLRSQLSFQDLEGRELAHISRKLVALAPTFTIQRHGQVVAEVKQKLFTLARYVFTVDVPGPDDLVAEGNLLAHEYVFTRRDRRVAQVSKRWITLTDTYGVDVDEGEDPILILATAVVIDQATRKDED
jgi:uncharacterized protein YxjI